MYRRSRNYSSKKALSVSARPFILRTFLSSLQRLLSLEFSSVEPLPRHNNFLFAGRHVLCFTFYLLYSSYRRPVDHSFLIPRILAYDGLLFPTASKILNPQTRKREEIDCKLDPAPSANSRLHFSFIFFLSLRLLSTNIFHGYGFTPAPNS